MLVDSLGIVGIGLIGSSIARGARQAGLCREVAAADADAAALERAVAQGVIDRAVTLAELQVDLLVLAVPVGAMAGVFEGLQAAGLPRGGTVVTDVGSVKAPVVTALQSVYGQVDWFVPGHPIAGSEQHGVDAGRADLFRDHRVILTPDGAGAAALEQVVRLWQGLGASVEQLAVAEHDRVLALTSHLPHLLAFALVDALVGGRGGTDVLRYAAGGFRDFTRIAASDPLMWRDIFLGNRSALLAGLDEVEAELGMLRRLLDADDGAALLRRLERASAARNRFGGAKRGG